MASDASVKECLIRNVKKEVKQIMEEAVTRKFVHEESSSVTSLCAAVEACLCQGLRRRALGLFKTSSSTALLHKVAKTFQPAAVISQLVEQVENSDPTRRSSSSSDSSNRISKPALQKNNSMCGVTPPKYLWIRLALFNKQLARIIDYLVLNANKYYEKDSLVADSDYGSILSSLLVGPCAVDYSRTKTQDHLWTDPPADELVQRHRISTGHSTPPMVRRPILTFCRSLHAGNSEESLRIGPLSAKDYVESLHQNHRATLLYGKNNVMVLPKEHTELMAGYLSLHQSAHSLTIKWTPNQLMNGYAEADTQDKRRGSLPVPANTFLPRSSDYRRSSNTELKYVYWEYALNVSVDDIVYVHCHEANDSGGTVILVGQDGVQRPPIHFPRGAHLLAFLSCLETGLLPHGQLDPPLWSTRGKGKVFPKIRRKARIRSCDEDEDPTDYVFRIVNKVLREDVLSVDLMEPRLSEKGPTRMRKQLVSSSTSSSASSKSVSSDIYEPPATPNGVSTGESIQLVCDTMKRQIISRAFYGWLAYCRHLSTVRTHLSGLVQPVIINGDGAENGLTKEEWSRLQSGGTITNFNELLRLTYYGGVESSIRKEVWPFLLGHYAEDSSEESRKEQDTISRQSYEATMSEWLAVEAIIRQRDKETMAANLAKLSSESTSGENAPLTPACNANLSNDVFEDNISIASDDDDLEVEEDSAKETESSAQLLDDEVKQNAVNTLIENNFVISENHSEPIEQFNKDDQTLKKRSVGRTVVITNASVEHIAHPAHPEDSSIYPMTPIVEVDTLTVEIDTEQNSPCVSPASSQGGIYSAELLETFGLNVHRIDKDVQRCDRNYPYFNLDNLEKLRNVMCTYVWEHLDFGYMQGMCDLVAPLLVILDEEAITYSCFCKLMDRMANNFPNGGAMDSHFANMRSLIQILDTEMLELMHQNGDYTHFYFCYRWFLLDFKRELLYDDVFMIWESIWAARTIASAHFVLFIALALVETYREIILTNSMDFTDIIKFFNEMAEHHDAKSILALSRDLVLQVQTLIENK